MPGIRQATFFDSWPIARGSAAEVKTQILIAQRLEYIDEATEREILAEIEHILRQLTALRSSIERHNGR